MNGLDLFSGIGGLTRALAGYSKPVAYCENDRYCQGVLLSRMANLELPHAPIWDDVRTLNASLLPRGIEIIYGGFPCQDISNAGRRKGLGGQRSGLFFEIVRLVGEIRPSFVFLENVSAIIRLGLGTITAEFTGLRYDCRWGILSASDVGAHHRRDRWWLLAHAMLGYGSAESGKQQDKRASIIDSSGAGNVAYANSQRSQRHWGSSECANQFTARTSSETLKKGWELEPNVGRVASGVPFRVDRLRALGNSVVPAQAREAFERLMGIKRW